MYELSRSFHSLSIPLPEFYIITLLRLLHKVFNAKLAQPQQNSVRQGGSFRKAFSLNFSFSFLAKYAILFKTEVFR